ncbi:MAG: sensor histidine kinase [Clostridiaceae bacterium]|nr:sensor histidine kinase [Clostridiaceae bacterium]
MRKSMSMTLRQLCEQKTKLAPADVSYLEQISQQLPIMADLTMGDVFIDCMEADNRTMLVLAQRSPQWGLSSYGTNTVGMNIQKKNEPAVYHAFESGVPVRDLKAITPENKAVRQNVLPLRNKSGKTIAVLVCEIDISQSLQQERKYDELEQEQSGMSSLFKHRNTESETIHTMREIHHMVKNNLQMVASILGLQSRKSANPETKKALQETINRVLSISSVHEMLLNTVDGKNVLLMSLLKKVRLNALSLVTDDKEIKITISGDNIYVNATKATAIAQVTNELLLNSLEHAFIGRQNGRIDIFIKSGNLYSTVSVEDNGNGFDFYNWNRESLGLSLATVTIRDKLGGDLRFNSDSRGTKAMFDFRM